MLAKVNSWFIGLSFRAKAVVSALVVTGAGVASLMVPAIASATGEPTAAEKYAEEAATKATSEGSGAVTKFAIGIIGLLILLAVVFLVWKLIRRVMH
jgi:hypothetical protein